MPNSLLDLIIPTYDNGGPVDYDPYSYTSLDDAVGDLNIELLGSAARSEIPTYDRTAQDMSIAAYNLRQEGLGQALDKARRGGSQSLFGMTDSFRDTAAKSGFVSAGDSTRQMEDMRKSILSDFGETQRNIGLQQDQAYLNLQEDVYNIDQAYLDDVTSAIGQLDPDDWAYIVPENNNENEGPAPGQDPPDYAGSTPGQTATGGDGLQYTWINGEWVNTDEQVEYQGSNYYTSIPSTNVGDTIVVDTGSGAVWYTWNPESNSYEQNQGSGGVTDPSGGGGSGIDKP